MKGGMEVIIGIVALMVAFALLVVAIGMPPGVTSVAVLAASAAISTAVVVGSFVYL